MDEGNHTYSCERTSHRERSKPRIEGRYTAPSSPGRNGSRIGLLCERHTLCSRAL